RRRRYSCEAERTRRALWLARERMRLMWQLIALGRIRDIDEYTSVVNLYRKRRNTILLEARLAFASDAMEFPPMPWALNVAGIIDAPFAQRTTDMVACVRYSAEHAVFERNRDRSVFRLDRPARMLGKFFGGAHIRPVRFASHDVQLPNSFCAEY